MKYIIKKRFRGKCVLLPRKKHKKMKKSYSDIPVDSSVTASEPVDVYGGCSTYSSEPISSVPAREQVLTNTVSVDQYFDELISLVRGVRGASVHQNS